MISGSMSPGLKRLTDGLIRREKIILAAAALFFVAVMTAVCFWKYRIFAYDGIDLAIFNQVFWNMLHGRFFTGSIHPHSYLGDHAELTMPLLLPLYALWRDPRLLLLLQAAALALPVWPLWLIAKRRLAASRLPAPAVKLLPLAVAAVYLASPFIQNIGLYEFHMLPFALLPLFLALLEYERERKGPFLVYALLALLTREDVALVLMALGLLAWIERKPRFWRIAPLLLSAAWFAAALKLIAHFAPAGGYKYSIYYAWLGGTPGEMAVNALRHPGRLIVHVITLANVEMILGFALPFMFLIFCRPARLILAAGPLLQFVLGSAGGGEMIMQLHYATLFLPALFLAFIEGLTALPDIAKKMSARGVMHAPTLLTAIVVSGVIYCNVILSPLPAAAMRLVRPGNDLARAAAAESLLRLVPPDASVAASYVLLPRLSSRERIYSLHYAYLGVSQFGLTPYELPPDTRFTALDTEDLLIYQAQFRDTAWAAPHVPGGFGRLRAAAGSLVYNRDNFQLFDRGAAAAIRPSRQLRQPADDGFCDGIRLEAAGLETRLDAATERKVLSLVTAWSGAGGSRVLAMRFRLAGPEGTVVDRLFPLANGLTQTSELSGGTVAGELVLDASGWPPGEYFPEISLEEQDDRMVLNGIRSMTRHVEDTEICGRAALAPIKME